MKIYKTKENIVIENENNFYLLKNENWDSFINDDNLYAKLNKMVANLEPANNGMGLIKNIEAPIGLQELWASGVTYMRSKVGRQEESKKAGGGDF